MADSPPERALLTKEKATGLITLRARAQESRSGRGVLHDPWAERAVALLGADTVELEVHPWRAAVLAARARQLDLWTADFLARHADATVLHLGCGLDSRVFRVDPPASVRWFDVDYPDVIATRERIYPGPSGRPGYLTIGASLAETDWLAQVPRDRPAWVLAEGVTMYLAEEVLHGILEAVTAHFPEGEVAFDAHGRRLVQGAARKGFTVGNTGAAFVWGLDDPADIVRLAPRLRPVERLPVRELARRFHLPLSLRATMRAADLVPALRAFSLYRFRF